LRIARGSDQNAMGLGFNFVEAETLWSQRTRR
jgi:hypothetical protein